jgi:peptidyl-prolyl cis-trans isomerase A (cyclophilin A)
MVKRLMVGVLAVGALAACDRGPQPATDTTGTKAPSQVAAPQDPAPQAPAVFRVRFETSRGPFVVESRRAWAPRGVDRFYQLVQSGFFDNTRFFRVVPGFVVQFGMHGDPQVHAAWEPLKLQDDSVTQSNKRGFLTFAKTSAPNSRSTQLFINLADNDNLDAMGFAPIGQIVDGMAIVDGLHAGYGEAPDQERIRQDGNAYLEREFPQLDFVRTARIVESVATDSASKQGGAK